MDSQAAFLGEDPNRAHIEYFQGVSQFLEPGLPPHLPAAMKYSLEQHPDILNLKEREAEAETNGSERTKISQAIRNLKTSLQRNMLPSYQESWT